MPDNKYALPNTTTILQFIKTIPGCILFKFYIKPQLMRMWENFFHSCILFEFYIKPQRRAILSLIICHLRAYCVVKNQHLRSEEVYLMQILYFKEQR